MENIYFQPTKENSEFLTKLEKLDEYTIPQILDRMVDHFRNLPELEDALNKLGIKTDSLKEQLDDDIKIKENYWIGGKPKTLIHYKKDIDQPVLKKEWYKNGQLRMSNAGKYFEKLNEYDILTKYSLVNGVWYYSNGNLSHEVVDVLCFYQEKAVGQKWFDINGIERDYYRNGQLHTEIVYSEKKIKEEKFFDMDGNPLEKKEYNIYKAKLHKQFPSTLPNVHPTIMSYDK